MKNQFSIGLDGIPKIIEPLSDQIHRIIIKRCSQGACLLRVR